MIRVFVLVKPRLSQFHQRVFGQLCDSAKVEVVGGLVDVRPKPSGWARINRELRRGRGGYVLVQIAQQILPRSQDELVDARSYFGQRGVSIVDCDNLYGAEVVEEVRQCRPDLLFRAAFGIIKEPLLSLAPLGVLSYHHGNLRKYRGQPVGFWELYHGEPEMSVTIQRLNNRLDAGTIISEITVPINRDDRWRRVQSRAYAKSGQLAVQAVESLADDPRAGVAVSDTELGAVYTTPNLRQWLTLQARVAARCVKARLARRSEVSGDNRRSANS